jgi:hypothetical protein
MPQNPAPVVAQPTAPVAVGSPGQVYRALRAQREVLAEQLRGAQQQRQELVGQLSEPSQTAATRAGIEKRIANLDARIVELDQQIARSDQAVSNAAAVPGATARAPEAPRSGPPEEVYVLVGIFMFIVLLPMSIAFARRIWRRSAKATVVLPPEMADRMASLERGLDAVALEIERIGEGQRFLTQALAERGEPAKALGAGAAQPIPVGERTRVEERVR